MDAHSDNHGNDSSGRVGRWVFFGFALVAIYFLYIEHRAHLFEALPYLLLAACPLMHLFHHHAGHDHHQRDPIDEEGTGAGTRRDQAANSMPARHDH